MFHSCSGIYMHSHGCYLVTHLPDNAPAVTVCSDLATALQQCRFSRQPRWRFRRRHVYAGVAIGTEETCLHQLRLARMPEDELAPALHWKISKDTQQAEDRLISGICSIADADTPDGAYCDVLGASIQAARAESIRKSFDGTGVVLRAIDTVPGAIARCFGGPTDEHNAHGITVVVLCDTQQAWLLACMGGELCFAHRLTGSQLRMSEITTTFGLDYDTVEMHRELRAGVHYILERFGDATSSITGTVVRVGIDQADGDDERLLRVMQQSSRIETHDYRSLLKPELQACLSTLPSEYDATATSIAFGMALHPDVTEKSLRAVA